MNTADILDKAADLIEERGWTQRAYVDDCGRVCADAATFAAVGIEPSQRGAPWHWAGFTEDRKADQHNAYRTLERWVLRHLDRFGVHGWNDAPERTKEEVVSTLRAAAQAARAEQ